jgi:phosphate transport system ATP-binding protein
MNKLTDLYRELKVRATFFIEEDDILNTSKNIPSIRQKNGVALATIPTRFLFQFKRM